MLTALKEYLTKNGYDNVYIDYMPAAEMTRKAINLTEWDNTVAGINDGTGTHYIQIQVRDADYKSAYTTCKSIFELLDSGPDETIIDLTDDVFCIARPRRAPLIYARDNLGVTIYCEIALWGKI